MHYIVSLPKNWTNYNPKINEKKQLILGYENEQIYRQPDIGNFKGIRIRTNSEGIVPKIWFPLSDFARLEKEIWWDNFDKRTTENQGTGI